MAIKKTFKIGKVTLDRDLEIPEFDFNIPPPKDDRKPVKKVFDGAISGAKSAFFSKSTLAKTLKNALPEGFGEALDLSNSVNTNARKLFSDAANQIKPSLAEMSRAAAKLTPSEYGKTKAALDSVAKWSKSNEMKYNSNDKDAQREAGINLTLNDVFKFQAEQNIKMAANQNIKDKLQTSLEISRHRDNFGLLNNISLNTSRLAQYQDKVTSAYQKKSLEIQYRSYFLAIDALEESKRQNAIFKASLESIAKNTALPDIVKTTQHESFKINARNKFWGSVNDGLFGGRNNIVGKVSNNIGSIIRDKLSTAVDAFSMATFAMEMSEMSAGMDDRGGLEKGADFAAGMGVDFLAGKAGKWTKTQLEKNKRIAAASRKIGSFATNVPQHLNEFKKSKAGELGGPEDKMLKKVGNYFLRAFKSVIPSLDVDTELETDRSATLNSPYHFTRQTNKSINEVIPGYLSRIYREIQVLRTGDVKTPLSVYDYTKNKFTSQNDAASSLLKTALGSNKTAKDLIDEINHNRDFSKDKKEALIKKIKQDEKSGAFKNINKSATQNQVDALFNLIDPDGTKLDEKARSVLADKLLDENLNSRLGSAKRLSSTDTFSDENSKQYAKLFADTFKNYFQQDSGNESTLNKQYNSLGSGMNDSRGFIQNMINLGQYDLLKSAGLINEDGTKINMSKLKSLQLGGSTDISGGSNLSDNLNALRSGGSSSGSSRIADINEKGFARVSGLLELLIVKNGANSSEIKIMKDFKPKNSYTFTSGSSMPNMNWNYKTSNQESTDSSKDLIDLIRDVGLITNTRLEEIKQTLLTTGGVAGGYKNNGSIFGSLKTLGKAGIDMASSLVKGGHQISKGFVSLIPFKQAAGVIGAAASGVKNFAEFGIDKLRNMTKVRDVFIEGEVEPRIEAAKLKAGKYFLEGKNGRLTILKDITGITGKIVDEFGETVIAADELGKMFTKNIKGRGFIRLMGKVGGWIIGKGNEYSKFMLGLIPPAIKMAKNAIMNTAKFAYNLLDEPLDIYVAGNTTPVMIARIMKNGGYISQRTNKVILHPREIDGAVMHDGKVVLTIEDIQKGLVDVEGNPIKLPYQKIRDFTFAMVKKSYSMAKKIAVSSGRFAKAAVTKTKNFVGNVLTAGLFGLMPKISTTSDVFIGEQLSVLAQIRDILDSRLPGGKKKRYNDSDGDGNREGSWRNMGQKSKDKKSGVVDSIKNSISDKLGGDGKPSIVGKIFNKMMGIKDKDEVAEESLSELTDIKRILLAQAAGGGIGDMLGSGGGKAAGKAGRFGRLGRLAGGAMKLGGKILPGAGLALGAAGAYSNIKSGNYGAAAVDAGLGLGGFALTGGSLAGLAGGIGAAGAAIGGILTAPVVLGALAIGAVGVGAYMGYKALTSGKSKMDMLRYVQYGFDPKDPQYFSIIKKLEQSLIDKNVKYEGGIARLSDKDFDIEKAISLFGVSQSSEEDFNNWISWFTGRFKPVFLTHLTALHSIDSKASLADIGSLKDEEQLNYFRKASFLNGPYDYRDSPISGLKQLPSGSAEVRAFAAEVEKSLKKGKKDGIKTISQTMTPGEKNMGLGDKQVIKETNIDDSIKKNGGVLDFFKDSIIGSIVTPLSAVGTTIGRFFGYNATPLETVRFKTYGLKTLERSKVSSLRSLEEIVFKDVNFSSTGAAYWSSSAEVIIRYAGKDFGVDSASSVAAKPWLTWFTKRFLPVYLAYLGSLKQATGKENQKAAEQVLKPAQELDIAIKVSATNNVWSVSDSPWEDYVLSSDIKDVSENIALMRDKAQKDEMVDAKKSVTQTKQPNLTPNQASSNQSAGNSISKAIDAKGGNNGGADGETPISATGEGRSSSITSVSVPKAAGGALLDGKYANQYLKLAPGVTLSGLNPDMLRNFNGMVEEYGNKTGNSVYVTSGFRTYIQQQALYKKDPSKAARPGGSMHEFGLALDVSSSTLDELDKMGLMGKYGFTRPVGGEPWHLEPAGIQQDIANAKNNPYFASQAIVASVGKGGGGVGSIRNSQLGTRNSQIAKQVLDSGSGNTGGSAPAKTTVASRGYVNSIVGNQAIDSESGKANDFKTAIAGSGDAMSKIPDVGPGKGIDAVKSTIMAAAKATGVDPNLMMGIAGIESSFDPNAKSRSSSAEGLYGLTDDRWDDMLAKHGDKYGISKDTPATNAKANALLGGESIKANMKTIAKTKPNPTNTDLYMAHFLGGTGANKLFSADPSASAADTLPNAAKSNKSMFYNGNTPRTNSELYSLVDTKVNTTLSGLGLPTRSSQSVSRPSQSIVNPGGNTKVSFNESLGSGESYIEPKSGLKNALTTSPSTFGFNGSNTSNQVQQDPRFDMNKAFGTMNDTLQQSLVVQTNTYGILKQILESVKPAAIANAMKEVGLNTQSTKDDIKSATPVRSDNIQRKVRQVPVPMDRNQT